MRRQGDIRWPLFGTPLRLVGEDGQEARQYPAQSFPFLGGVGLDHEPWRADGPHLEEARIGRTGTMRRSSLSARRSRGSESRGESKLCAIS